eukprot:1611906-Amphidinium_carterae.1
MTHFWLRASISSGGNPKRLFCAIPKGRHPNDERSHLFPDLRKLLRGNAPGERAPSDAGCEHL